MTQARSRIDRIYATMPVLKHSRNWKIDEPVVNTDHDLISVEFSNPGAPYIGKGRWSPPLYLLKDRKVIQHCEQVGRKALKKMEAALSPNRGRSEENNPQVIFAAYKKRGYDSH